MDDESEPDLFTYYQLVPHKGLARIIGTLEALGITKSCREWIGKGGDNYPRLEHCPKGSVYTLSMGVSRQVFIGYTSWFAFHAADAHDVRSSIILLCYSESERFWLREWSKGAFADRRIEALIQSWFPKGEQRQKLEHDGLVNATLQHLINAFHGV